MRNSALNSILLLFLLLTACSPEILKGFRKDSLQVLSRAEFYPFFPTADSTQWFNMQIDFRKNHFSGILLVKRTGTDTYRTVFTTHFGMSVFDFEFTPDKFIVNHCIEDLNKKKIRQTFEEDFKIFFFLNLDTPPNQEVIYKNKTNSHWEVVKKNDYYYLKDLESKTLLKIERPRFINSLHYEFKDYRERFPSDIQIKHSTIGLKIQLNKIEISSSNLTKVRQF
jgi:hypothetical protein